MAYKEIIGQNSGNSKSLALAEFYLRQHEGEEACLDDFQPWEMRRQPAVCWRDESGRIITHKPSTLIFRYWVSE